VLNTLPICAGARICPSGDQARALVAGRGTLTLVTVVGKKLVFRDCEVIGETPRKLVIFDLRNGINENIQLTDCYIDFFLDFNHLIVVTASKLQIYKCGQWTTPIIFDTREVTHVISQASTMFAVISASGAQIMGYDGRVIARITETKFRWDLLSQDQVAVSPAVMVCVNPDGRKHVFAFSTTTGQSITAEPLVHPSEVRSVKLNQATSQGKSRLAFTNSNGDLTVCRFITTSQRGPPTIESQKVGNFIEEFFWHSSHDLLLTRTNEKLTIWCCPSAVFFTAELMPRLKMEVRVLFDVGGITAFDSTHAYVYSKDGSFCIVPVSPFLIGLHEAIDIHHNWKIVLQVCRAQNETFLWALCAASAVMAGEIDVAQEAYASLMLIDRVIFLEKVKSMKSPAARNAMIAILQGRLNEAEEILIQGGCLFRAVKMNISMGRWEKALGIAKRISKYVEVVAAYRAKYIASLGIEETVKEFLDLGQVDLQAVQALIRQEKSQEMSG
jgi:intraflagellar transport protein 80